MQLRNDWYVVCIPQLYSFLKIFEVDFVITYTCSLLINIVQYEQLQQKVKLDNRRAFGMGARIKPSDVSSRDVKYESLGFSYNASRIPLWK